MRASAWLNQRQTSNLLAGVAFSEEFGPRLNTSVDINLFHSEFPFEQISARFEKLRDDRFGRWVRYESRRNGGVPPTYAWVIECPHNSPNIHWLVHIPEPLKGAFDKRVKLWVNELFGVQGEGVVKIQKADKPRGKAIYMAKGTNPTYAKLIKIKAQPQGVVYNKRCGVSKNLGPTARARAATETRSASRAA